MSIKETPHELTAHERSLVGVDDAEGPPVPIPNTVVKLFRAEDTWRVTAWENRSMPTQA